MKEFIVLDFGSQNIKVLVASKSSKQIRIKHAGLLTTPEDAILNGMILNPDAVSSALSDYLYMCGIRCRDAVLVLTSPEVIIREMSVPSIKPAVIKGMLAMDSSDLFPVDLNEYVLDYKVAEGVTEVDEEGNETYKVILAAAPNELVDSFVSVLDKAGLNLESIDIASDSITKLYKNYSMPSDSVVAEREQEEYATAFVDLGYSSSNVVIAVNDTLKYNKVLPFGSKDITKAIADTESADLQDAEYSKYAYKIPEQTADEPTELDKNIAVVLSDFISDLSIFFDFHSTRKRGNRIDEVVLYGGGANLKNLGKHMSRIYKIPVLQGFTTYNIEPERSIELKPEKQIYFYNCLGALANL